MIKNKYDITNEKKKKKKQIKKWFATTHSILNV